MGLEILIDKVGALARGWGEELEPPATSLEIDDLVSEVVARYSARLPEEYLAFLRLVNGLEVNGLIIYGTKNSESDSSSSPLGLVEMNDVIRDSVRFDPLKVVLIGEDGAGLITYDDSSMKFQYRDRIGLDRVETFESFEQMLATEIEKVI